MTPTIKDVARKANVSIATVSLVVNNSDRISSDTRKKVLKVIKELNYHPSRSARGLVSRKTGNIGFILTDDHFLRTEPFYTKIFLGTEFEAHINEYYILLTTVSKNFTKDDQLPRFVLERSVDGIIIAGKVPSLLVDSLYKQKLPVVFVDYVPSVGDYSTIMIDNIKGGSLATQHLIDLGHKKISFVAGDINHPSINDRFHGYKSALEKAGISVDNNYIITDEDYPARSNGYNAARKLFTNRPDTTAVFACNDAMAIGLMQYLKENNFKVPEDVSIIGFDDVEVDLPLNPLLTTIRVPKIEIGAEAVRLLVGLLKKKDSSPKKIFVPIELIVRNSTMKIKHFQLV
ncbi:LacI family DNA-binding transcriptional regulator [Bacteroidota bacterium]